MPPTGTKVPGRDAGPDPLEQLGLLLGTQAYCCADEQANRRSGCSSASATTLANVRAHLRMVSRTGHSQAESMCACPAAETRWRAGVGGRGEHVGQPGARGAGAVRRCR